MAEEFGTIPRPIREGIHPESFEQSTMDRGLELLQTVTGFACATEELLMTGDLEQFLQSVQTAIQATNLSPAQKLQVEQGFSSIIDAFATQDNGPQIVQKPHLRILRREENK